MAFLLLGSKGFLVTVIYPHCSDSRVSRVCFTFSGNSEDYKNELNHSMQLNFGLINSLVAFICTEEGKQILSYEPSQPN